MKLRLARLLLCIAFTITLCTFAQKAPKMGMEPGMPGGGPDMMPGMDMPGGPDMMGMEGKEEETDNNTTKSKIDNVMKSYKKWFGQSFLVDVKSVQLNAAIKQIISNETQKTLGMPVQVSVDHFQLLYTRKGTKTTVKLDASMAQMENQANMMFQQAGLDKVISAVSLGAVKQALKFLHKQKDNDELKILRSDENVTDIMIGGLTETFLGKTLSKIAFRIENKENVISRVKFFLADGASAQVSLTHKKMENGDETFPVLTQTKVSTKGAPVKYGKITIPKRVSFIYSNYRFK
ncbi:MAG: hypothetical protein KAI66_10870 [Lentisphaeria bacterium]|nr:hypothetical protein [Lentisphaeria bacterium]